MTALAQLATRRPRAIIALGVVFFVLAGYLGSSVFDRLDPFGFTDPESESVVAEEEFERASGEEPSPGIIVLVEPGEPIDSAQGQAAVERVVERLSADPSVARVVSYLDAREPALVSDDGEATYVSAFMKAGRSNVERLTEELEPLPGVTVGGIDVVSEQIGVQVEEDLRTAELMAFPLLLLLSFFVFRSFVAALLPLLVGGIAIVGSLAGLRALVELTDISIFAVNLVTGLGLGLAIDYSLFVVSRYREEIARVGPGAEAMRATMRTAGRTVVFSALTVATALAALLVFPQLFLRSMGIGGALVALLAALVSLTVLPAVLALLGERVYALAPRRLRRAAQAEAGGERGRWYRFSRWVMRRPGTIAAITAALMIVAGLPFLRSDYQFADARILPEELSGFQVDAALRSEFDPRRLDPVIVQAEAPPGPAAERRLATLRDDVSELDHVVAVGPPVEVGEGLWRFDARQDVEPYSEQGQQVVEELRAIDTPLEVRVAGASASLVDQQISLTDHLVWAVAIIALTTFVLLFLMTGSVILPLKALLMNLLTVSVAFGFLVVVFQDGRFEGLLDYESLGALDNSQPILLFAAVFGLSTDYGVFLLTRIKEARDAGAGERESVALGLERTGRIVTFAALLFSIAIGAFVTSEITFLKQVGLGIAVGVLVDATIVRALLVPSLMALLGRWNWWAPRPLRRFQERLGLAETG